MNQVNINLIYVENSFIYKIKDLLKDKDVKNVIDYNTILDKSLDKTVSEKQKKQLIGILILKKLKKIINKNEAEHIIIHYVIGCFNDNIITTINNNIKKFYQDEINYCLYTDSKTIDSKLINNIYKLEKIKL